MMKLTMVSVVAVVLQVLLQHQGLGLMWDVLTPVLVAVGLVAPRGRAIVWVIVMSFALTAAMRVHPLVLMGVWIVAVSVVRVAARGLEWERRPIGFAVAALTSAGWHAAVLLLNWFGGVVPTLDLTSVISMAGRAVTAGLAFVVCGELLTAAALPARAAADLRAVRRQRYARE